MAETIFKKKLNCPQIVIKLCSFNRKVYQLLIDGKVVSFIARQIDNPKYALQLANLKLKFLTFPYLLKDATKAAKRIILL